MDGKTGGDSMSGVQSFSKIINRLPPSKFVQEMMAYHDEHGAYHIDDVLRVLGDQTKATVMTQRLEDRR